MKTYTQKYQTNKRILPLFFKKTKQSLNILKTKKTLKVYNSFNRNINDKNIKKILKKKFSLNL